MFRLEKVFQNDDKFFISTTDFFKVIFIYLSIYIFSILEQKSLYEIKNYNLYLKSNYYFFSLLVLIIFFLLTNFLFKTHNHFYFYNTNVIKKDFLNLSLALIFSLLIYFILGNNININFLYLSIFLYINLYIIQILIYKIYNYLVNQNIIQKNILLIGNYESIKKVLNEKKNNIYVYKCCIIIDKNKEEIKKIRTYVRIPIFEITEDIRSLLEYHSLGQVWILDDNKIDINLTLNIIIKFSVDIIIIRLFDKTKSKNLINYKYNFSNYEISRFHGYPFLIKILLDKILSIFFIIILLPILLICIFLIYLEDGYPIFFTQDRTGWDGRRFKIYKLRSLKNIKFKKTDQVILGDDRLLNIGKFIRKFSIDEVPQFFNVLFGDMSIVGPRPHMVEHDIFYSKLFKDFLKRHKANPGITGWAQIHGLRGPTHNEKLMQRRMEYDLWYLNNWSIFLDFTIILKTIFVVFKHKGT